MKTHYNYQATVHDSFQDIFDYVAEKLMEQGEKAINYEKETCQYRQEHLDKTLKCAVGWLIPDEQYNPGFEDHEDGLEHVLKAFGVTTRDNEYFTKRFQFLRDLQRCHDDVGDTSFRNDLRDYMDELASKYKLDTTHLYKVYWSGVMSEPSP